MDDDQRDSPHAELTERLIGFAMAVDRGHGPGLDENSYENSMGIEMSGHRTPFTQQEVFPIYYKGRYVSRLITDLIVDQRAILENKVLKAITVLHISQPLVSQ